MGVRLRVLSIATVASFAAGTRSGGCRLADAMRTTLAIVLAVSAAVGQENGTAAASRTTGAPESRPETDDRRREVRFVMEDGGPVPRLMVYGCSPKMVPPDGVVTAVGVRGRENRWHFHSGICTPRFVAATSVENGLRLGALNVSFAPEGPPVTIRLRRFPTLRGRVVDAEGRPLQASPMPVAIVDGVVRWSNNNEWTNDDGTFEVAVEFDGRILPPDANPTAACLLVRGAVVPLSVDRLTRGGDLGTLTMRYAKVRFVNDAGAEPLEPFLVDPRAEMLGPFRFPVGDAGGLVDEAVADGVADELFAGGFVDEAVAESTVDERGDLVLRAVAEGCVDEIVRIPASTKPAGEPPVPTVRLLRAGAHLAVRVAPWTAPVPLNVEAETADGSPLFVSSGRPENRWDPWLGALERPDRAVASVDADGTAHFRGVRVGAVVRLRLADDVGPFGTATTATTPALSERSVVEIRLPGVPWGLRIRTLERGGAEFHAGVRAVGGNHLRSGERLTLFREFVDVQCVDFRGHAGGLISRIERKADEQVADLVVDRGFGAERYDDSPGKGRALLRAVSAESRPRSVRVDFVDVASGELVARDYDVFEAGPRPVHIGDLPLSPGTYRATAYVGRDGPESSRPRFETTVVVRAGETTVVDVR